MSNFDVWLSSQPTDQSGMVELLQARSDLGAAWPAGGDGWSTYAIAISQSPVIADKVRMLECHESQRAWLRKHHGMDNLIDEMKRWGATQGKAEFTMEFLRYSPVPKQAIEELLEEFREKKAAEQR